MKKIALFLHQPKCSVQSGNGIMNALSSHYSFKIFTRHEVERDFFDDVDCVAVPGGIGDASSFDYLFSENGDAVKRFVRGGGKYLGICMGAYWPNPSILIYSKISVQNNTSLARVRTLAGLTPRTKECYGKVKKRTCSSMMDVL